MLRDIEFSKATAGLGDFFDGDIKVGGNYAPLVRDGNYIYISGQIPRFRDRIAVTGRAGAAVSLEQAQLAAKLCAMRGLALLQRSLGSLERVRSLLRMNVFVQSAETFTQQSEVADGASDLLHAILGQAGVHARTSVGVFQLPKNATVELDLVAVVE